MSPSPKYLLYLTSSSLREFVQNVSSAVAQLLPADQLSQGVNIVLLSLQFFPGAIESTAR